MGVFSFLTDYHFDAVDVPTFFTLILLEAALSFDNAAVLAAVVRHLPLEERRKALLYGLGGAYAFRIIAILAVSLIIQNPWLKLIGGAYLIYLMLRHVLSKKPHEAEGAVRAERKFLGLSAFWSVVITVELMDIAFALDQVTAAVGLFSGPGGSSGDKRLLIILASMVAILLLRISAYYVGKIMDWFPRLETFAYVAVGWVGVKLVVEELAATFGYSCTLQSSWQRMYCSAEEVGGVGTFEFSRLFSVAITFLLLVLPVLVKAGLDYSRRRRRGQGART